MARKSFVLAGDGPQELEGLQLVGSKHETYLRLYGPLPELGPRFVVAIDSGVDAIHCGLGVTLEAVIREVAVPPPGCPNMHEDDRCDLIVFDGQGLVAAIIRRHEGGDLVDLLDGRGFRPATEWEASDA